MIKMKQGIKLSAIVDKLDLQIPKVASTGTEAENKKAQEQAQAELMLQVVSKFHRAENEIYEFVSVYNKCTVEEAQEVDLVEFVKNIIKDVGVRDFLSSAVNSKAQE